MPNRHRHDKVKTVLNRFCLASNIRAECEVFGAFRDLIPVHALEEQDDLQRGRGWFWSGNVTLA